MDLCVHFNYSGSNQSKAFLRPSLYLEMQAFAVIALILITTNIISHSTNAPLSLPAEVLFIFICGDRAWAAIPSHIKGSPCRLGQLSLLTPNTSMILQHRFPQKETPSIHAFAPDCDDNLDFWSL